MIAAVYGLSTLSEQRNCAAALSAATRMPSDDSSASPAAKMSQNALKCSWRVNPAFCAIREITIRTISRCSAIGAAACSKMNGRSAGQPTLVAHANTKASAARSASLRTTSRAVSESSPWSSSEQMCA
eukprot:Amastigsp_a1894_129.p6 type:complete len:128 gc:universal Amastigsp_a1894_129:2686-3069(+)